MIEFVDRPTQTKFQMPEADPEIVQALIETSNNGRAIILQNYLQWRGAIHGPMWAMGYNVHHRRLSLDEFKVWATKEILYCDECSFEMDMVALVAVGQNRLPRRERCPQCRSGRMIAPKNNDESVEDAEP